MDSLGSILKKSRINKNLSLEEINKRTKINLEILKKIEADQLEDLEISNTYLKLILKSYGKEIDVSFGKIKSMINTKKDEGFKPTLSYNEREENTNKVFLSKFFFPSLGLIILVIILGLIVYNFYEKGMLKNPLNNLKKKDKPNEKLIAKDRLMDKEKTKVVTKNEKKINEIKQERKEIIKEDNSENKNNIASELEFSYVRDSIDYIDKYLFKNKNNQLNYKEENLKFLSNNENEIQTD